MVEAKEPKRILHIVSAMNRGGAETLLMNIFRNIDREKVQFDFISHRNEQCDYDGEIITLGGEVYRIPSLGQVGPFAYMRELTKIMSKKQYVAVHTHTDYQGGIAAIAAKIVGIEKRICHSHSSNWSKGSGFRAKVILKALQFIMNYAGTDYCACSIEAARFLFKEKLVRTKVKVMKNGIDTRQFIEVDACDSTYLKKELDIPDNAKIIGHIGHFSESKNHDFILKVLKEMVKRDKNFIVVLVGEGPLKDTVKLKAKELGICSNIRFLGVRSDIPQLIKLFDVFLFPSLFEGFGIVTLEAQCSGTPCVVADTIPKDTDMGLGLISFVSLNENFEIWSREIYKALQVERPKKQLIIDNISDLGFDIRSNIPKWLALYGLDTQEYVM